MNKYLNQNERLINEEVLSVIPYKPFSVLIITNQRLVGKAFLGISFNRFKGEVLWKDVVNVKFSSESSLLTTPHIVLLYRKGDGKIKRSIIRFPGLAKFYGFDPQETYYLIMKHVKATNANKIIDE